MRTRLDLPAVACFAIAAFGGIVALPGMHPSDVVWLAGAAVAAGVVLVAAPAVSALLARGLADRISTRAARRVEVTFLARLVVAGLCVVVLQAMLRQPLALAIGGDPFVVEASFVGLAFVLLVAVLTMLFKAARPLVEDLVTTALDAGLATLTSDEPTAATVSATQPVAEATLVAPKIQAVTRGDDQATLISPRKAMSPPQADDQGTLVSPKSTQRIDDTEPRDA